MRASPAAFPAAFRGALLAALALALPVSAVTAKPAAKAAGAAKTGSATVADDVRCMLAMVAYSNINKQNPQAGQAGVYFFAGRISSRAPTLDLNAAVRTEAANLGPQQLQAEVQRCGPMVNSASQRFQTAIAGLKPPGAPAPAAGASASVARPAPALTAPAPATPPLATPAPK